MPVPGPDSPASWRCAAHPARPAVDACPTCGRPRCGADAQDAGCTVCGARPATVVGRPAGRLELVVRAALSAYAVALVAGLVNSEYIGSDVFSYLAPAVAGVATGAAAVAAGPGRQVLRVTRGVGALLGVAAVALGFVLEGTYDPTDPEGAVLIPYAVAAAASWLWTAPPRRKRPTASPVA